MRVYLDHAATTPCDERVVKAMRPFFGEHYGNPSSQHWQTRVPRTIFQPEFRRKLELLDLVSRKHMRGRGRGERRGRR